MNNFINFLLEYYIWILIVLGIVIVTIIGFLVDSNRKRKKKEASLGAVEVKTVEPLPEVNNQNATPIVDSINQPVPTSVDSVIGEPKNESNFIQEQFGQPLQQVTNGLENQGNNNVQNTSLNEQKPHFESNMVSVPQTSNNENNVVIPQPINPVSITQSNPQPTVQPSMQYQYNQGVQPMSYPQMPSAVNQQYMNNMTQQQMQTPQNLYNSQVSGSNMGAYNMNNQQSYQPQTMYQQQPAYSQSMNYGQSVQQPLNVSQESPVAPSMGSNVGISFVTGENNNPSNDDTWEL